MHLTRLHRVASRGSGNFVPYRPLLRGRLGSVRIGNAYFATKSTASFIKPMQSKKIDGLSGRAKVADAGPLSKGETAKTMRHLADLFSNLAKKHKPEETPPKPEAPETAPAEGVDLVELRNILDDLAQQYLSDPKDLSKWYSAENMPEIRARLRQLTERKILAHFDGSFVNLLKKVYPEHEWQEWKFSSTNVPAHFWDDVANQRRFFDSLAREHKFTSMDDFYRLSTKDVESFGGAGLLASKYKNSFVAALEAAYPRHQWLGWRFAFVPTGYWDDKIHRKKFFEYAILQVGASFDREDSLRRLSIKEINRLGGGWMLQKFYGNSVSNAIGDLFPAQRVFMPPTKEEIAELEALERDRRARASELIARKKRYDGFRKVLNFFIGSGDSGAPRSFHKLYEVSNADIEAAGGRELLRSFNGSIFKAVQELFPEHQWLGWKFSRAPINFWRDLSNHREFFEYLIKKRPGGEISEESLYDLTPEMVHQEGGGSMLAEYYSGRLDSALQTNFPEFSETLKLWKFSFNTFSRKHWATVAASTNKAWMQLQVKSFLEHMSQHPNLTISSVQDWSRVSTAQVLSTRLTGFVKAFGSLEAALRVAYPEVEWVEQKSHKASTQRLLVDIIRNLIPNHQIQESPILADRFEVDIFIQDLNLAFEYQGEQHFIDIRRSGDSQKARGIDASKAAELKRLSISLIEVKHQKSGKIDVAELIQAIRSERPEIQLQELSEIETSPQSASVRVFFDSAAQTLGLTSLDDWYGVSGKQVKELEGGIAVLKRFGNSLRRALQAAFPEKEWLEWRFNRVPPGFWSDRKNRQRFLFYIMKKMNPEKDPDLSDLYYLPTERLIAEGGGGLLANEYSGSFVKCLRDTFPEHEWHEWRFAVAPLNFWSARENRVRFFEWVRSYLDLKALDGFYMVTREQWDQLGGASLMKYHSRLDALRDAYPDHKWLPWKFDHAAPSDWKDTQLQRAFLEWVLSQRPVATDAHSIADQLKTLTKDEIDRFGGSSLLLYHGNNIAKMVSHAFPDIFWPEQINK